MSVELISVLVCSPGNRGDLGRADPDQQSRTAEGLLEGLREAISGRVKAS